MSHPRTNNGRDVQHNIIILTCCSASGRFRNYDYNAAAAFSFFFFFFPSRRPTVKHTHTHESRHRSQPRRLYDYNNNASINGGVPWPGAPFLGHARGENKIITLIIITIIMIVRRPSESCSQGSWVPRARTPKITRSARAAAAVRPPEAGTRSLIRRTARQHPPPGPVARASED